MPKNKKYDDDDFSLSESSDSLKSDNDSVNSDWEEEIDELENSDLEEGYEQETDEEDENTKKEIISSDEETDSTESLSDEEEIETETENNYKNCPYDFTNDTFDTLDELPENEKQDTNIVSHFQNIKLQKDKKIRKKSERITKPYLTEKERIRLLSLRTDQIAKGAKSFIKGAVELPPNEVAKLELEHKKIPLIIERELPDGTFERWKIDEFL